MVGTEEREGLSCLSLAQFHYEIYVCRLSAKTKFVSVILETHI